MITPCMAAAENLMKLFVVIQPGSADVCHPKENGRPDARRFAVSGISQWQLDTICTHLRIRYARCYRPTFLGDRAPNAMIAAYSPSEIYFNSLPLSRDQRCLFGSQQPGRICRRTKNRAMDERQPPLCLPKQFGVKAFAFWKPYRMTAVNCDSPLQIKSATDTPRQE
jgi:hypothetical protein